MPRKILLSIGLAAICASFQSSASEDYYSVEIKGPDGVSVPSVTGSHRPIQPKVNVVQRKVDPKKEMVRGYAPVPGSDSAFSSFKYPKGVDAEASAGTAEVKKGELFWTFASRTLDKSSGANINQQLAAIFRKNIKCFPDGRYTISESSECRTLALPTKEQALAENSADAARMLHNNGITKKEWDSVVSQIGTAKSDLAAKEDAVKKAEAEKAAAEKAAKAEAEKEKVSDAELTLRSPNGKPAVIVKDGKLTEEAVDEGVSSLADGSPKIVSDSAAAPAPVSGSGSASADDGVELTSDGKMIKEVDGTKVIYDGNTITAVGNGGGNESASAGSAPAPAQPSSVQAGSSEAVPGAVAGSRIVMRPNEAPVVTNSDGSSSVSAGGGAAPSAASSGEIKDLKASIEALRADNQALRKELKQTLSALSEKLDSGIAEDGSQPSGERGGFSTAFTAVFSILLALLCCVLGFFIYKSRRTARIVHQAEAEDDMLVDSDDNFDHLMTQGMVPDAAAAGGAAPQADKGKKGVDGTVMSGEEQPAPVVGDTVGSADAPVKPVETTAPEAPQAGEASDSGAAFEPLDESDFLKENGDGGAPAAEAAESSAAAAGVDEAYVEQQLKLADAYLKLNNDDDAKKVISDLLSTADGAAADRIRQMAEAAGLGSLLGEKS